MGIASAVPAALLVLPLLAGGPSVAGGAAELPVSTDSVRSTVHAFHQALAAGDSAAALELLHRDVRVFEGGHAETLSEYRAGHLAADMEFSGGVDRQVLRESVSRDGDRALYLSEYRMTGTFRGRDVEARGTETMVLVRTGDGWRIRHIHWSSR